MSISRAQAASFLNLVPKLSLVANRVAGQFEKHVLKVGENRAEVRNPDPILRKTMNYLGDKIVASTPNRELRVAAEYRLDSRSKERTPELQSRPHHVFRL